MSVLGLLVAGGGLVASAPTAAAAPLVTVEITTVTVSGTAPTDQIELRGRVSNPTGSVVYGLRMAMWRSRDPIDDLATVRQVAVRPPWGVILPSGYTKITEQSEAFPAGAVAEFALNSTLADLGFDTPGAVYPIGARALGTTDGGTSFGNVGQAVTLVAVPGEQPVPVTRVVVLTAPSSKFTSDVFRNDALASQLRGRLGTLLAAAAEPGMSWLIDPGLYDEVADMADGYQVQQGDSLVAGTGQAVAADWLRRFQRLDPRAGGRTLFATPDLTGAALAGDADVLARAQAATAGVTRLDRLPLVILPTAEAYTTALDHYLADTPDTPLLATNLLTAGAMQSTPDGRPVLASAVSLLTNSVTAEDVRLVLAETLVAGDAGQLRVLREAADLAADRVVTTDWMQPRRLDELLASQPTVATAEFSATETATMSAEQFGEVAKLEQQFAAYGQLAPESTVTDEAAALLTRAVSTAWLSDPDGQQDLLAAIDDLVGPATLAKAASLDASSRFVMSARTNQFPMTVTNNLTEPIRVKVVTTTDNPQRLTVPDTPVISIPAGQSATVTVHPEATANGVAIAHSRATTEAGEPASREIRITIEMTELGFIGWLIVIISGAVVLGSTAFRLWQVRRRAAGEPVADVTGEMTEPDAEPSSSVPEPGDD